MSQQYVSPFSEKVKEICDDCPDCDECPLNPCGPLAGETDRAHAKRINAKAEEVGE